MKWKTSDSTFKKQMMLRDRGHCRYGLHGCSVIATDVSHIYSRSFIKLRCHPLNALMACRSCHNQIEASQIFADKTHLMILGDDFIRLQELKKGLYYGG